MGAPREVVRYEHPVRVQNQSTLTGGAATRGDPRLQTIEAFGLSERGHFAERLSLTS